MFVSLITCTPNAKETIYTAYRQCYSSTDGIDVFNDAILKNIPEQDIENFIYDKLLTGHDSPLEHISFTFGITGVSRSLTHQLVRHRIASYSHQSQRYVEAKQFGYITPPSIEKNEIVNTYNETAQEYFDGIMEFLQSAYQVLVDYYKTPKEDARFVLPNACETKIIVTMNCRSLINFFELRCCNRAQWEIREMANKMLQICKMELPCVFGNVGAKCEKGKYCPENKKYSCGKYPTLSELFKKSYVYDTLNKQG